MRLLPLALALLTLAPLSACSSDEGGGGGGADPDGGAVGAPADGGGGDATTGGPDAPALPSEGCSRVTAPLGATTNFDLQHAGNARLYSVHVPPGHGDKPVPLIVNIHGFTSSMALQEAFAEMSPRSDAEGYVVAYPDGLADAPGSPQGWQAGTCCVAGDDRDDVGFIRAVVAEVGRAACIDLRRVYATGMSNGGFMAHRLGCEAADLFAAVAPVAGVNGMDPCAPSRPVPIIHFHGTADTLIPYPGAPAPAWAPGSQDFASVADSTAGWVERNGCEDAAPKITFENGATSCETWSQCDAGVQVTLCTSEGAGHCWPGTAFCLPGFGDFTTDISASDEMWTFFRQYSLP